MKVSVIIPTRNEPLIDQLVKEVNDQLKDYKHEIIVIDKSDRPPKLRNAKIVQQKSTGLGKAVIEALEYVTGDVVITMDGDMSHDPKDLPKFLEKIKHYDIVLGSKYVKGGRTEDSLIRYVLSRASGFTASTVLQLGIKDLMSGFAAVRKKVYDSLDLDPLGYKIHMETIFKGKQKGFSVCEVPITFHKRAAGKSKFGAGEFVRTLIFLLKLRFS